MLKASTPRRFNAAVGFSNACLHGRKRAGGNCPFPSGSLTRRGSGVKHVFVATSVKYDCFFSRLRRCEAAAVPVDLYQSHCSFRDGLRNCSFGVPHRPGLPRVSHQFFPR